MKKICLLSFVLLLCAGSHAQDYWQPIPSGTTKHLYAVSFGSRSTGYAGGADSTLLKTTDGGLSWTPLTTTGLKFTGTYPDITDLDFVSADTGFIVVNSKAMPDYVGAAYRTTDGGVSWQLVDAAMSVYKGYYFNGDDGYLLGMGSFSGPIIARYKENIVGAPVFLNSNPPAVLRAVTFIDTLQGMIGNGGGFVFRTFDGGKTWDTVKTNVDTTINTLLYVNDSTIVAGTADFSASVIVSTDRGATWSIDFMTATFYYPVIEAAARSHKDSIVYAGTSVSGEGILYWYDDWLNIQTVAQPLHDLALRDDSVAYAVGDSGLIVSNARSILGIGEIKPAVTASVYPNPGNGLFTSEMNLPHTATIYDISGRKVLSMTTPATKQLIDLREQPKGIYLVALRTSSQAQVLYSRITLQ